jgi:hypothetical protein
MEQLYKHKSNGKFYRLIKLKSTGLNTFLEVDEKNKPTVKKRPWTNIPREQTVLMRGFEKIELLK